MLEIKRELWFSNSYVAGTVKKQESSPAVQVSIKECFSSWYQIKQDNLYLWKSLKTKNRKEFFKRIPKPSRLTIWSKTPKVIVTYSGGGAAIHLGNHLRESAVQPDQLGSLISCLNLFFPGSNTDCTRENYCAMEPLLWSSTAPKLVSLQGQSSWPHLRVAAVTAPQQNCSHPTAPAASRAGSLQCKDLPFPNTQKQKFPQLKTFKWTWSVYSR